MNGRLNEKESQRLSFLKVDRLFCVRARSDHDVADHFRVPGLRFDRFGLWIEELEIALAAAFLGRLQQDLGRVKSGDILQFIQILADQALVAAVCEGVAFLVEHKDVQIPIDEFALRIAECGIGFFIAVGLDVRFCLLHQCDGFVYRAAFGSEGCGVQTECAQSKNTCFQELVHDFFIFQWVEKCRCRGFEVSVGLFYERF